MVEHEVDISSPTYKPPIRNSCTLKYMKESTIKKEKP